MTCRICGIEVSKARKVCGSADCKRENHRRYMLELRHERPAWITKACRWCGKKFQTVVENHRLFCSATCRMAAKPAKRAKIDQPTRVKRLHKPLPPAKDRITLEIMTACEAAEKGTWR